MQISRRALFQEKFKLKKSEITSGKRQFDLNKNSVFIMQYVNVSPAINCTYQMIIFGQYFEQTVSFEVGADEFSAVFLRLLCGQSFREC